MGLELTDSLAVLEALTPDPGWETDVAFLSSYSVDLVAVAAVVTALAGEGDNDEGLRTAPLARACERLRDRVRVVCQAGRVVVPSNGADTLVLADRWIREVPHDGNERCWHAKLALVRYRRVETEDAREDVSWRLWIGSRNLTRDTSWDSALVAVGEPGTAGDVSRSIADAGAVLARYAALPDWSEERARRSLRGVSWRWPTEVREVRSFALWPDATDSPVFPPAEEGLEHFVAVSPFVDGATARALGRWGGAKARRQLLSVPATLERLGAQALRPLDGFSSLHAMDDAPPPGEPEEPSIDTDHDQMVEVHRGLHAKLLWTRSAQGDELWLGSANLTARAWGGANTEVMVRLQVEPSVGKALCDGLVGDAPVVEPGELAAPTAEDADENALDKLRNSIAARWQATLRAEGDHLVCATSPAPIGPKDGARLTVRMLGEKGAHPWPEGDGAASLPAVPLHRETELVVLELALKRAPSKTVSWVARAVLDPSPTEARDRAVLARLMGPRAFLAWLRSLLDEVSGDGDGEPWPIVKRGKRKGRGAGGELWAGAPTLEAVLRAWGRDRARVVELDRVLGVWGRDFRASVGEDADPDEQTALQELERFEVAWTVLRDGLGLEGGAK